VHQRLGSGPAGQAGAALHIRRVRDVVLVTADLPGDFSDGGGDETGSSLGQGQVGPGQGVQVELGIEAADDTRGQGLSSEQVLLSGRAIGGKAQFAVTWEWREGVNPPRSA
jgi:hypothetical protein